MITTYNIPARETGIQKVRSPPLPQVITLMPMFTHPFAL